jgi:hypothetical protein
MALLMGHLPWLGQLYLWLPGMGQGLRAFRKYAADRASERKARGSHHKDVFYHLVWRDVLDEAFSYWTFFLD